MSGDAGVEPVEVTLYMVLPFVSVASVSVDDGSQNTVAISSLTTNQLAVGVEAPLSIRNAYFKAPNQPGMEVNTTKFQVIFAPIILRK